MDILVEELFAGAWCEVGVIIMMWAVESGVEWTFGEGFSVNEINMRSTETRSSRQV